MHVIIGYFGSEDRVVLRDSCRGLHHLNGQFYILFRKIELEYLYDFIIISMTAKKFIKNN